MSRGTLEPVTQILGGPLFYMIDTYMVFATLRPRRRHQLPLIHADPLLFLREKIWLTNLFRLHGGLNHSNPLYMG